MICYILGDEALHSLYFRHFFYLYANTNLWLENKICIIAIRYNASFLWSIYHTNKTYSNN